MFPCLSFCNVAYRPWTHSVGFGNVCKCLAVYVPFPDSFHIFSSYFGPIVRLSARLGFSKEIISMFIVFSVARPFQIINGVVSFNPVFMIHGFVSGLGFQKCFGDQAVNGEFSNNSTNTEGHYEVPFICNPRFDWSSIWTSIASRIPSHSSPVAYRIIRKLLDCFPNLQRGIDAFRHVWPFYIRLPLFRRARWFDPFGTPTYYEMKMGSQS